MPNAFLSQMKDNGSYFLYVIIENPDSGGFEFLLNGLSVQVPPFIESGDEIIIDTRNLEYIKKI